MGERERKPRNRGTPHAAPSAFRGARAAALRLLAHVDDGHDLDGAALAAAGLGAPDADPRERALCTELAYGVLRTRGRLDHALSHVSDRPLTALDPGVLRILRVGAYQLLVLSGVPVYAAVDEAVRAAQADRIARRAAGFVNAVLRALARRVSDQVLPQPPGAPGSAEWLSVETSHPRWLVERWLRAEGAAWTRALCDAHERPAPLYLRVNLERTTRDALLDRLVAAELGAAAVSGAPEAVVVRPRAGATPAPPIPRWPGFAEGHFVVQDLSSQLVSHLLAPAPGARVLDACAAPGGKATHLATLVGPTGHVVALDRAEPRLARVRENAARLGLESRLTLHARDAAQPPAGHFDAVLLDAPCTGLGLLRRHPEIRWRRTETDVARAAAEQRRLLDALLPRVSPGGVCVYAVCSTTPEEGEAVVAAALASEVGSRFRREGAPRELVTWSAIGLERTAETGTLATWPHVHDCDGFYAVRLRAT